MGPSFGTNREERIQGFQVFKETIKFTSEGGGKGGAGVPSVSCKWMPKRPTPIFLRLKRGLNNVDYVN